MGPATRAHRCRTRHPLLPFPAFLPLSLCSDLHPPGMLLASEASLCQADTGGRGERFLPRSPNEPPPLLARQHLLGSF